MGRYRRLEHLDRVLDDGPSGYYGELLRVVEPEPGPRTPCENDGDCLAHPTPILRGG